MARRSLLAPAAPAPATSPLSTAHRVAFARNAVRGAELSQTQGIVLSDDLRDHPFAPRLEADDPLLWVGRPDEAAYIRRQRRGLSVGVVLGCLLMASCLFTKLYNPSPADDFFLIMYLILLPMTLIMGICFTKNACQYAPWYALTHRHLFAATPDDNGFMIHRTDLNNIKGVLVRGQNADVGMVCCSCYGIIPSLMSRTLRLEGIKQPEIVAVLIAEAMQRALAVV